MKLDTFSQHLVESSLSRIQGKLENHSIGAITAFRGEFTRKENLQRNKKLLAQILRANFQVTTVKGSYIENHGSKDAREVGETSFIVVNPKEGDDQGELEALLKDLGREYDQDSILSVRLGKEAELVGTSDRDNAYPGLGVREPMGTAKFGADGEFFSRLRGRPFKFESVKEVEKPDNRSGLMGLKAVAEKSWKDIQLSESELRG